VPFLVLFFSLIFHVIAYLFYVFPFVHRISPCIMHMLLFPSCCLFPHCLIDRLTCVFTFLYTDIYAFHPIAVSYSITLSSRPFMYLYSGISHIARNIIIIALDIFARLPASLRWFAIPPIPTYIIHLGIHAVPTTYPTFLIDSSGHRRPSGRMPIVSTQTSSCSPCPCLPQLHFDP